MTILGATSDFKKTCIFKLCDYKLVNFSLYWVLVARDFFEAPMQSKLFVTSVTNNDPERCSWYLRAISEGPRHSLNRTNRFLIMLPMTTQVVLVISVRSPRVLSNPYRQRDRLEICPASQENPSWKVVGFGCKRLFLQTLYLSALV